MQDALIFYLTQFMSTHYRVKHSAPDCYITCWLFVSDCSLLHRQFDKGCHMA